MIVEADRTCSCQILADVYVATCSDADSALIPSRPRGMLRTSMPPQVDAEFDQLVFHNRHLVVGHFVAHPSHQRFGDSGPAARHLFVFPRTAVEIQHEGQRPFVAGTPVVTFYNRGQRYTRRRISSEGDRCDWFALSPTLLTELLAALDLTHDKADEAPFRFSHGPSDAATYARQRRFIDRCLHQPSPDALEAEEEVLHIASRVITSAAAAWRAPAPARTTGRLRSRDLAEDGKALILQRLREPLSVTAIAAALHCSPFHLCRTFRHVTGWTLHQFRDQARLRLALAEVRERRGDLTHLALDLGYSSHSHFTQSFRRAFGMPPSHVRAGHVDRHGR